MQVRGVLSGVLVATSGFFSVSTVGGDGGVGGVGGFGSVGGEGGDGGGGTSGAVLSSDLWINL